MAWYDFDPPDIDVAGFGSGVVAAGKVPVANGAGAVTWQDQSGGGGADLDHAEVLLTSTTTTTSTIYVDMAGTSVTAPSNGTYLLIFTTKIDNSSNNQRAEVILNANGSDLLATSRWMEGARQGSVAAHCVATLLASQVVKVRWRCNVSGTNTARQRVLSIVRIGP